MGNSMNINQMQEIVVDRCKSIACKTDEDGTFRIRSFSEGNANYLQGPGPKRALLQEEHRYSFDVPASYTHYGRSSCTTIPEEDIVSVSYIQTCY